MIQTAAALVTEAKSQRGQWRRKSNPVLEGISDAEDAQDLLKAKDGQIPKGSDKKRFQRLGIEPESAEENESGRTLEQEAPMSPIQPSGDGSIGCGVKGKGGVLYISTPRVMDRLDSERNFHLSIAVLKKNSSQRSVSPIWLLFE